MEKAQQKLDFFDSLSIIFLCLPSLFFALFCERYVGDGLPPPPVCATFGTPLINAGGKDAYRIDTARHCPNSLSNSQSIEKPHYPAKPFLPFHPQKIRGSRLAAPDMQFFYNPPQSGVLTFNCPLSTVN